MKSTEELAARAAESEANYSTTKDIGILQADERTQIEQLSTEGVSMFGYNGDSTRKLDEVTDFDFDNAAIWFRIKFGLTKLAGLNLKFEDLIQPDTVVLAPLSTGLLELHQMRAALIKEGKLDPPFTDIKIKTIATAKSSQDTYPGITDIEGLRKFKKIIFYDDTITDSMTTLMLTRETIAQLCQEAGIKFINPFDLLPTDEQQRLLSEPKLNY